MSSMLLHPEVPTRKDFLPITGTDYIEFYVGNARQSAYYYRAAFGMTLVAWAGPATGLRDRSSYVLQQGDVRFILTTPLRPDGGIADHIHRHGDGVRDIAFSVGDAKLAWREATKRGARSIHECRELRDDFGSVKVASIAAYGDTIHTFVERDRYYGPFLPGYEAVDRDAVARPVGISHIDHIAGTVGWNELHRWVDYYSEILGFSWYSESQDRNSPVAICSSGRVVLPIHEPCDRCEDAPPGYSERSTLDEYLQSYHGPGVQHIALATGDIVDTVTRMRQQGVEFLSVPPDYYRRSGARIAHLDEPLEDLASLGILVSRDKYGLLMQACTRPVEDRPTLFFEIVGRESSRGLRGGDCRSLANPSSPRTDW